MPIKDLAERRASVPATVFPRLAKVNKGAPKRKVEKNGREIEVAGSDLDHFRVTFEPEYERILKPHFVEMYGEQPSRFTTVMLAGRTVEEVFPHWYEDWVASKMLHRCDGEIQTAWYDRQEDRVVSGLRPCEKVTGGQCNCRQRGVLHFYLPEFSLKTQHFGYFSLATGAWADLGNLIEFCREFESREIPLDSLRVILGRRKVTHRVPMTDKETGEVTRKPKDTWELYITLDPVSIAVGFLSRGLSATSPVGSARLLTGGQAAPPVPQVVPPPESDFNPIIRRPPTPTDAEWEEVEPGTRTGGEEERPPQQNSRQQNGPRERSGQRQAEISPGVTDWAKPPASSLIPEIRRLSGQNPPELFRILAELGSAVRADMDVNEIARLVAFHDVAGEIGATVTTQPVAPPAQEEAQTAPPPSPVQEEAQTAGGGGGVTVENFKRRESPLLPKAWRELVRRIADRQDGQEKPSTQAQQRKIAMLLQEALPRQTSAQAEGVRHTLTHHVFGKIGTKALSVAEALALILILTGDDPARLHPHAMLEVQLVTELAAPGAVDTAQASAETIAEAVEAVAGAMEEEASIDEVLEGEIVSDDAPPVQEEASRDEAA